MQIKLKAGLHIVLSQGENLYSLFKTVYSLDHPVVSNDKTCK